MVRLLIVEDSRFLRLSMEKALIRAGYQVASAMDGLEGLKIARQELPDAILLDLLLPKLSGVDVLRELKNDDTTKDIPVIILTSLSQMNAAKLEKDGAAAFVEKNELMLTEKPGAPSSLVAKVESVLKEQARSARRMGAASR
jgi:CheY-like chemotaxis protein